VGPRHAVEGVSISWSDPAELTGSPIETATAIDAQPAAIVEDLRKQSRRARQPSKREGYDRVADWLDGLTADDIADLLERAAGDPSFELLGGTP